MISKILDKYFPTKKTVSQKCYFKYTHNRYWAKKIDDNTIEFWAYSAISTENWYLGKYKDTKITECENFYHSAIPWSVQKGALKLFEVFDVGDF